MSIEGSSLQNGFRAGARSVCLPILVMAALLTSVPALAGDWTQWRGASQTGESGETGLISSWSPEGENLIWRQDYTGRSTPVVHGGRVFVTGRAGTEIERREILSAFDAETGELLWERTLTTQLTTVPFQRAGWAGPAVDRETGYVYAQGVAGPIVCYDRDGNLVWSRMLYEELGRFSGYGGRTHTPLIDEDRLLLNVINSSWGKLGRPAHRYFAFDKKTGDILWISTPGGTPYDLNTTANGSVTVIGGRRLYINGNADGSIYALEARTGKKVWSFELSKRGVNSSPVVVADTVYAGHSEENVDEGTLGRIVAIDATGSGDVTKTHEKWRRDIPMGFPSPLYHDGRLYVQDNSANMFALNAETGDTIWEHEIGTVGKSAPVWADGKIYTTEVNGRFTILRDRGQSAEVLDEDVLTMPGEEREAEVYASPAVAYGRIYFATEEGLYCLGDKGRAFEVTESAAAAMGTEGGSETPATMLVVPADVTVGLGDQVDYEVRTYNDHGRELGRLKKGEWGLEGLRGGIDGDGLLTIAGSGAPMAGEVVFTMEGLEARARVRAFGDLPYEENFDDIEGRGRPWWLGSGRYQVVEMDGGKVLEKPVAPSGLLRSNLLIGPPDLAGYTVQADLRGAQKGRRRTDAGVVNQGYILDLLGNSQKLQIRSWSAEMRMAETIDYEWEMDVWYTMKLRVDVENGEALVRGKVWPRGQPEPADWTITARDPQPNASGAPGIQGYSPAPIHFDNVRVTAN